MLQVQMTNTRDGSVLHRLRNREFGVKCNYRLNTNLLKYLISQESRVFKLVWENHSRQPIFYENQKVYLENYKLCYTVNGINGEPEKLYTNPPCLQRQKIEDGLICEFPVNNGPLPRKGCSSSFLALTSQGWLIQLGSISGQTLEKVFLSKVHRFKYLSWNDECRSIVIKSVLQKPCPQARRAGFTQSLLATLCIFSTLPLQFIGMMEIHRLLFGKDITDAMIGENLLCISHQCGFVRLYSVQHILQEGLQFEANLGEMCSDGQGLVGGFPNGLPLNVILNSKPPVLFEVKCVGNDLRMGGVPWHYIIMPPNNKEVFQVYSMTNDKLAVNGTLQWKMATIRPHKVIFHPDDSGRIVHIVPSELRIYRLTSESGTSTVSEGFSINMLKHLPAKQQQVTCTSSGRQIRRRQFPDMSSSAFEQSLETFSYENETDILVVLGTELHGDNEDDTLVHGHVHLYDNISGKCLKKLQLKRTWLEHMENNITLDLDVLINIRREVNGRYSCYVYRLFELTENG